MKNKENIIDRMERDALYAYLELLSTTKRVPEKKVYESILKIKDGQALDTIISLIENEHGQFEKYLEEVKKKKKASLFYKFLYFFKNV